MKLTLKQARYLELKLKKHSLATSVVVRTESEDVMRQDIESSQKDFGRLLSTTIAVNDIRHDIREAINQANMKCGVTHVLAERDNYIAARMILQSIGPGVSADDLIELQIPKGSTKEGLLRVSAVSPKVAEEIKLKIEGYDKGIETLNEMLKNLNDSHTIELDHFSVETLKNLGYL